MTSDGSSGPWDVVHTRVFDRWLLGLDAERATQVGGAIQRVREEGPLLCRPRADSIKGSRIHNLKELRLHEGLRVLFAFDPNRRAVMLLGGDKAGNWSRWYRKMIPVGERLYADHLRTIGKADHCLSARGAGPKARARSR